MTFGAAPKRHVAHWHGYGFLLRYHQPPNNSRPVFGAEGAVTRDYARVSPLLTHLARSVGRAISKTPSRQVS